MEPDFVSPGGSLDSCCSSILVPFIKPIDPLCLLNTFITPDIELMQLRSDDGDGRGVGGARRRVTPNNWTQNFMQMRIFPPFVISD